MNRILQVKPIVFLLFFLSSFLLTMYQVINYPVVLPSYLSYLNFILTLISTLLLYLWVYVAGTSLHRFISDIPKSNITLFNICIIVTITDFLYSHFFMYFPSSAIEATSASNLTSMFYGLILFVAYIYCIVFVSKTLVYVESGSNLTFSNYWREFFSIFFLVIGIFWMQPRIQTILQDREIK